jgi:hypothetical protein
VAGKRSIKHVVAAIAVAVRQKLNSIGEDIGKLANDSASRWIVVAVSLCETLELASSAISHASLQMAIVSYCGDVATSTAYARVSSK